MKKFTTIEQYRTWLKTNPAISEILKVQKQVLIAVTKACDAIVSFFKRKKTRSCIWKAGIVAEPTSAAKQGIKSTILPADWGDQPDETYQHHVQKMYENLRDEIIMEELYCQGLEILAGNYESN